MKAILNWEKWLNKNLFRLKNNHSVKTLVKIFRKDMVKIATLGNDIVTSSKHPVIIVMFKGLNFNSMFTL